MTSEPFGPHDRSPTGWLLAGGGWLLGVLAVWGWMTAYQYNEKASAASVPVAQWPAGTALQPAEHGATLVFFVHPKCPCTRASARQLQRLLDGNQLTAQQRPRLLVVASHPASAADDWSDTDTVRFCAALPRAAVVADPAGVETQRFGCTVSGTLMLFDAAGRCRFCGGITAARGLEGDCAGGDSLLQLLTKDAPTPQVEVPVFGCQLCRPQTPAMAAADRKPGDQHGRSGA